jgi:PKD repeat protein
MTRRTFFNAAAILALVAALFGLNRAAVSAAPALNDSFANATLVGSLPFSDTVDLSEATTEPSEPQYCNFLSNTAWYVYTPVSNTQVQVDTQGSNFFENGFSVYRAYGPNIFDLSGMGCTAFGGTVSFSAQAGETYYIQAGMAYCAYPPCGGVLQLNVQEIPPPPNDNLANAITVPALPFEHLADLSGATREPGEPHPSCEPDTNSKTVWYAFTPSSSGSVMAHFPYGVPFNPMIAAYTGTPAAGLTEVGCRSYGGPLTFQATAGTTYYFQVAALFGGIGSVVFRLEVTPPPQAGFGFYPGDASILDTVQFYDSSYDPAGAGIQSWAWNFGDGSTATGCCPTHRYAADGNYTVELTVTTYDGRTASASQTVAVTTHDVSITKFQVPTSASAGQTRQIVIGIRNNNQPETVRVDLYRSTPSGFRFIGSLEQFVPVRSGNRTTDFQFSYTFTADDAALGKVNFSATAVILGSQDRLPTDNQAISTPTKVGR